jgi:hypothetical protein
MAVTNTHIGHRFGPVTLNAPAAGTVTIDWTAIAANTRLPADRAPDSAVVCPLTGGLPGDEPEEPG